MTYHSDIEIKSSAKNDVQKRIFPAYVKPAVPYDRIEINVFPIKLQTEEKVQICIYDVLQIMYGSLTRVVWTHF